MEERLCVSIPSEEEEEVGRVREDKIRGGGWWIWAGGVQLGTGSFHPGVATRC